MANSLKTVAVYKLALAGERAGFSIEEMIQMLNNGLTVENLICLIEWKLRVEEKILTAENQDATIVV